MKTTTNTERAMKTIARRVDRQIKAGRVSAADREWAILADKLRTVGGTETDEARLAELDAARNLPATPVARAWYDLPMAAGMWRADARSVEHG